MNTPKSQSGLLRALSLQLTLLALVAALLTLLVQVPKEVSPLNLQLRLMNFLPLFVAALLLYGLLGRLWTSVGLLVMCSVLLRHLHVQKMEVLEAPLMAGDMALAGQTLVSPDLALEYLGLNVAVGLVFVLLVLMVLGWREVVKVSIAQRAMLFLCPLLLVFVALAPLQSLYAGVKSRPWIPDPSLQHMGVLAFMIRDYIDTSVAQTPKADMRVLEEFRRQHPLPDPIASSIKPDVVLYLSESFFSPGILRGVQKCQHIPNYCQLAARFDQGGLLVPTYGGQTIRTEFEILTGVPMAEVPGHPLPYMSLTNTPVNSIAWELKSLGYETAAIHNHKRGFWRRPVALKNLGFDYWAGKEDFSESAREGYYTADRYLTDEILRFLGESESSSPQFLFAISMQAHGPHGGQKSLPVERMAEIEVPARLGAEAELMLQQYLYHLRDVDDELLRLWQFISERPQPTILLYFGDHLPAMGKVFRQLKFRDGLKPRAQATPYLLAANYELKRGPSPQGNIASWQLPTLLLNAMGAGGENAFSRFDQIFEMKSWSPDVLAACTDEACEALRNFQYLQLQGPLATGLQDDG